MLSYILSNVICNTFETEIGRNQNRNGSTERKALLVSFRIPTDYTKEEGYRHLDLLVYGPKNYVGVYTRERATVAPIDPNGESEDEVDLAGPYVKTVGEWKCIGYHDSCWTDAVRQIINDRKNDLITFDHFDKKWYTVIQVPEEVTKHQQ